METVTRCRICLKALYNQSLANGKFLCGQSSLYSIYARQDLLCKACHKQLQGTVHKTKHKHELYSNTNRSFTQDNCCNVSKFQCPWINFSQVPGTRFFLRHKVQGFFSGPICQTFLRYKVQGDSQTGTSHVSYLARPYFRQKNYIFFLYLSFNILLFTYFYVFLFIFLLYVDFFSLVTWFPVAILVIPSKDRNLFLD